MVRDDALRAPPRHENLSFSFSPNKARAASASTSIINTEAGRNGAPGNFSSACAGSPVAIVLLV